MIVIELGLYFALLSLLTFGGTWLVSGHWERLRDSPWRPVLQRALAPPLVGLIFAGGYIIATPHTPDWRLWLIALVSGIGTLTTRLNSPWLLVGGAMLGTVLL